MGATLEIGVNLSPPLRPARLLAHRFNRHTFWCGQSGSGKTYALGVVLEQLLLNTSLPMVIFDPNADFVRLGELSRRRPARRLRPTCSATGTFACCARVTNPPTPLRVRFTELSMPSKAAVLRLDPLADRAEYNALLHLEETIGSQARAHRPSADGEREPCRPRSGREDREPPLHRVGGVGRPDARR